MYTLNLFDYKHVFIDIILNFVLKTSNIYFFFSKLSKNINIELILYVYKIY